MATPSKYFLFFSHSLNLPADSVTCRKTVARPLGSPDVRHVCIAQSGGRLDQRIEYNLQIKGRAADDLEHVGGGGPLLERLTQLVKQPRVLYGDDGLRGEICDQLDLLVGEGVDSWRRITMTPMMASSLTIGTARIVRCISSAPR